MKVFSPSTKRQIKDCILAIFWPKKDIFGFFRDCSVPKAVLKSIDDQEQQILSRAAMIDRVFDYLSNQPDNGTFQFDLMLEALERWDHFDTYWFEETGKLDKAEAEAKLKKLRRSKKANIDDVRAVEKKRRDVEERNRSTFQTMAELKAYFSTVALDSVTPQERGFALEKFLVMLAHFYDLKVTDPFRIRGTQIDGTIKYDGENYSIEAKWHHHSLSDEPILAFCRKQEINMHGRGIFISINGYSADALSILERGSVKNTVLMDGEDLSLVLAELITLPELLDSKIRAAQTQGRFYIHPISGSSKISH